MYGATNGFTEYTQSTWETEIRDRIIEELSNDNDFKSDKLTVDVDAETASDDTVTVTVTATYPFETTVDWPGLPHEIDLKHQITMQRFR